MNRIVWLTGQSGAGKTTVAEALQKEWPCTILDGDAMRLSISLGAGFSKEDRTKHNLRVARLAKVLSEQGNVVVSVIAPMACVRDQIGKLCDVTWVYVKRTLSPKEGHFYEEPENYFTLDHDRLGVGDSVVELLEFLESKVYSLFIGRYQPLHAGHIALIQSVIDEGKFPLVALRATVVDSSNPHSVEERKLMFKEVFEDKVKVIVIPDIDEVCYGRKVGWGIRQIHLDKKTEEISATEIRGGPVWKRR